MNKMVWFKQNGMVKQNGYGINKICHHSFCQLPFMILQKGKRLSSESTQFNSAIRA